MSLMHKRPEQSQQIRVGDGTCFLESTGREIGLRSDRLPKSRSVIFETICWLPNQRLCAFAKRGPAAFRFQLGNCLPYALDSLCRE
jgi:hypothetical protein